MKDKFNTTIVCNPGIYAEHLKAAFGEPFIIDRKEMLPGKIKKAQNVLILAELTWENRRYGALYGYDLALKLIDEDHEFNLAFFSFFHREKLKSMTPNAGILGSIFPHFQLPMSEENYRMLRISKIGKTKWDFIRHYLLDKSGMVDKLAHDIKHWFALYSGSEKAISDKKVEIEKLLALFDRYRTILSRETLRYLAETKLQILNDSTLIPDFIEAILLKLANEQPIFSKKKKKELDKSHFKMLIVEDNESIRKQLHEGFENFFRVTSFSNGKDALNVLNRSSNHFHILLIDLELVDKSGNWQTVHGLDLLEAVSKRNDLLIYVLTSYSKRAISTIERFLQNVLKRKFPILPKGKNGALPDYMSYPELAEEMIKKVKENLGIFSKGPKIGLWKNNGLLAYYYQVKSPELWQDVFHKVERFFACNENNDTESKIIPTRFPQIKTQQFTVDELKTLLMHRLICLYLQLSEGGIDFQNGLRKMHGFEGKVRGNLPQYFSTYLGLGREKNGDEKVKIILTNLFPEEEKWLKEKFPGMEKESYPDLCDSLSQFREDISDDLRNQFQTEMPGQIRSQDEILNALNVYQKIFEIRTPYTLKKLGTSRTSYVYLNADYNKDSENFKVLSRFQKDIKIYLEYSTTELKRLKKEDVGILRSLKKLLRYKVLSK